MSALSRMPCRQNRASASARSTSYRSRPQAPMTMTAIIITRGFAFWPSSSAVARFVERGLPPERIALHGLFRGVASNRRQADPLFSGLNLVGMKFGGLR